VSAHSAYHHGEVSLNQTIIGLAQDFVGINNINALYPDGGHSSREAGGKDHAAA
jgi:DNA topoisomerase-2